MNVPQDAALAEAVLRVRLAMMAINERVKAKAFSLPVHLALGHEAIAVAVAAVMDDADCLLLTHRNVHYNLARTRSLRAEVDEYLLRGSGQSGGLDGAMNLTNPDRGIVYTSSILGNCLPVAVGVAMAERMKGNSAVTFAVTGDGAMEEGAFYETLTMAKSLELPLLVLVENNGWSMYTQIHERRCSIDLESLTRALGVPYMALGGNDVTAYRDAITGRRAACLAAPGPAVVEVALRTLGDWVLKDDATPDGRPVNYHHGPAPTVMLSDWPVIRADDGDPVHVLARGWPESALRERARQLRHAIEAELA